VSIGHLSINFSTTSSFLLQYVQKFKKKKLRNGGNFDLFEIRLSLQLPTCY